MDNIETSNVWDDVPNEQGDNENFDWSAGDMPLDENDPTAHLDAEDEQLKNQSEQKQKPQPEKKPVPEKKRYKLKIDNEEQEFDEDEVVRRAQKAAAADKRFQEAAELRKQSEQLVNMLREDPFAVLEQLGLNPAELAHQRLQREVDNMRMSPEERELRELRNMRERVMQQQMQAEEQQRAEREQQQMQALSEQYTQGIIQSLEAVDLPRHEGSIKQMVHIMQTALQNGIDISWDDAAKEAKRQYFDDYKQLFTNMSDDQLESILGKDTIKRLVKRSTKQIAKRPVPIEQPERVVTHRPSVWD